MQIPIFLLCIPTERLDGKSNRSRTREGEGEQRSTTGL